jgi:cytoskeletal protein RodZ
MFGRNNDKSDPDHLPLQSADPMSSGNPYASQSPRGFEQPEKKSRKKLWIILGVVLALIVIIGAVLGGVLGSRSSNNDSSSGNKSSSDAANGNVGAPSGVSNVNSEAVTATNEDRYLAIATDSQWMLPVYPTGVSHFLYSWK